MLEPDGAPGRLLCSREPNTDHRRRRNYIYEIGGTLQNSGLGKAMFTDSASLYSAGGGADASKVESMVGRQMNPASDAGPAASYCAHVAAMTMGCTVLLGA